LWGSQRDTLALFFYNGDKVFSRKEIIVFAFVFFIGLSLAYSCRLEAGEWNEKPVMCVYEKEIEKVLKLKGETLFFAGKQLTKVRTETGLAKKPVNTPFRLYVNKETGTFTVLEYHPSYKTFCVIAYGLEFQDFREML